MQSTQQKRFHPDVDRHAARLSLHFEIADRRQCAPEIFLARRTRRFPFLVQWKRMWALTNDSGVLHVLAESFSDGVFEAVVVDRRTQIDVVQSRVGMDGDHLPQLFGERKKITAV